MSQSIPIHRLLLIPELWDITLAHLDKKDCTVLLRVSNWVFRSTAPSIWGDLSNLCHLLFLINGAKPGGIVTVKAVRYRNIDLPKCLDESHFTRFKIYAPFVRKLSLYREDSTRSLRYIFDDLLRIRQRDDISDWTSLLEYASSRVLLPNLTTIRYRYLNDQTCENWLRVLLSPSVCVIQTARGCKMPKWGLKAVYTMLGLAVSRTTSLHELHISPGGFSKVSYQAEKPFGSPYSQHLQLFRRITNLRKLRVLCSNIAVLYPWVLPLLGELIELHTLEVDARSSPPLTYDTELSGSAFPSLRKLVLKSVDNIPWIKHVMAVKPLFQNLQAVTILMATKLDLGRDLDDGWAEDILLRLCESSPRLSHLTFHLSSKHIPITLSAEAQAYLRRLQLKQLSLRGLRFEVYRLYEYLSTSWPEMTVLEYDGPDVDPVELVHLAKNLPHLEELVLDLDLSGSSFPNHNDPVFSSVPKYTAFRCLVLPAVRMNEHSPERILQIAHYLYFLWPSLQCELLGCSTGEEKIPRSRRNNIAFRQIGELNSCIEQLRSE